MPILLVFVLATIGSKILLALAIIYALLPTGEQCSVCDAGTVPLAAPPGLTAPARLLRIQRRWCPHCGETVLTRRAPELRIRIAPPREPQGAADDRHGAS
ncbi:MAG TPA: hypothetical protein VF188_08695 [Longimicrobiales bacterium]